MAASPPPGSELLHHPDLWRVTPAALAEKLSGGEWKRARHLDYISQRLCLAAHRPNTKLIISVPVDHGKSEITSKWNPVWYLDRFPRRQLILLGHGHRFAEKWGRRVRNLIVRHQASLNVRLSRDSTAAADWETSEGGGMLCTGIGGDVMGEHGDLLVIDDYCKDHRKAFSKTERENWWEWWTSTAKTRLKPNGSVVIVATRWHPDDLIGRLLEREDGWEHIVFPALATGPDLLGRKEGEALWPERWPLHLLVPKMGVGWVRHAIYQQDPRPLTGGLFEQPSFRHWHWARPDVLLYRKAGKIRLVPSSKLVRFGTVDLAASEKATACWTVVSSWGVAPDGSLFLLDRLRAQIAATKHDKAMQGAVDKNHLAGLYIEDVAFQLSSVQRARAAGLPATRWKPKGSKEARALTAAIAITEEEVFFPAHASWLGEWEDELLAFPGGESDQVDTLSCAVDVKDKATRAFGRREGGLRMGGGAGPRSVGKR